LGEKKENVTTQIIWQENENNNNPKPATEMIKQQKSTHKKTTQMV